MNVLSGEGCKLGFLLKKPPHVVARAGGIFELLASQNERVVQRERQVCIFS